MKFLSALFFSLLISTTAFAQHNPVYSGSTAGGSPGGGATTSSAGVTRPTNTSDSFAVGAGSSGSAPMFFNPTTGQLEINVAGGGVVADADATLGGTLVLQEGDDDGNETFTIGVTDTGLTNDYTCTLQDDGTFLPANCPFNAAAGSTLAGLSDTTISGTPTTNHVLTYTGSVWEPQAAASGSATNLNQLSDVTINSSPANNEVLTYNSAAATWEAQAATGSAPTSIGSSSDVTITSPTATQVLTYDGSVWANAAAPSGVGTQIEAARIFTSGNSQVQGACAAGGAGAIAYGGRVCITSGAQVTNRLTALGMTGVPSGGASQYQAITVGNAGTYTIAAKVVGIPGATSPAIPEAWCGSVWINRGGSYPLVMDPVGIANDLARSGSINTGTAYYGYENDFVIWELQANDQIEIYADSCNNQGATSGAATNTSLGVFTAIGATNIASFDLSIGRIR